MERTINPNPEYKSSPRALKCWIRARESARQKSHLLRVRASASTALKEFKRASTAEINVASARLASAAVSYLPGGEPVAAPLSYIHTPVLSLLFAQ